VFDEVSAGPRIHIIVVVVAVVVAVIVILYGYLYLFMCFGVIMIISLTALSKKAAAKRTLRQTTSSPAFPTPAIALNQPFTSAVVRRHPVRNVAFLSCGASPEAEGAEGEATRDAERRRRYSKTRTWTGLPPT
jgi:hypothetical protein